MYLIDQRRLLLWLKMTISDNVVLFNLSRLIVNQFMAVRSRYCITAFSISPRTVRLKIWISFASTLTFSPEDVHSSLTDFNWFYCIVLEYLYFVEYLCIVCLLRVLLVRNKRMNEWITNWDISRPYAVRNRFTYIQACKPKSKQITISSWYTLRFSAWHTSSACEAASAQINVNGRRSSHEVPRDSSYSSSSCVVVWITSRKSRHPGIFTLDIFPVILPSDSSPGRRSLPNSYSGNHVTVAARIASIWQHLKLWWLSGG